MSTHQDLMDDIALLVGGTKLATSTGFYSGARAGDATGVSGVKGCYSQAPWVAEELPVGIVLPGKFRIKRAQPEENTDMIRLLLMVKKVDMRTDIAILNPFRDSVPAAFRAHMALDTLAGATALNPKVLEAYISGGSSGVAEWAGESYWSWDFEITVIRLPIQTYTA